MFETIPVKPAIELKRVDIKRARRQRQGVAAVQFERADGEVICKTSGNRADISAAPGYSVRAAGERDLRSGDVERRILGAVVDQVAVDDKKVAAAAF